MPRRLGQVDGRGQALAPAECGPGAEGLEDRLRQRDMSRQCGMVAIVERVVVEDAVGTDPPQYGQAIDQDTAVPPRHGAIGLLQRGWAADRIAVAVAGQDVVPVRLGVGALLSSSRPARRWASANSGFRSRIARYPASASAGSRSPWRGPSRRLGSTPRARPSKPCRQAPSGWARSRLRYRAGSRAPARSRSARSSRRLPRAGAGSRPRSRRILTGSCRAGRSGGAGARGAAALPGGSCSPSRRSSGRAARRD